jgi:hypothetical protein
MKKLAGLSQSMRQKKAGLKGIIKASIYQDKKMSFLGNLQTNFTPLEVNWH